ncbi:MAG: M55 family metallopeptidase [Gallicola sp.]|nr:M55 family metallopeptidase [Gallicola sp.]
MIFRILILSDVEGAIGVTSMQDTQECDALSCKEVRMAVFAILSVLPDAEIHVCSCHNNGESLEAIGDLGDNCTFSKGIWNLDLNVHYDFAMLLGFHAMYGKSGFASHSFRHDIDKVYLGDEETGEIGIFSNYLLNANVPVLLVSCDSEAMEESQHIPNVFITKNAEGQHLGQNLESTYDAFISMVICAVSDWLTTIEKNRIPSYNKMPVRVKLIGTDSLVLLEFSKNKFLISHGMVEFEDTVSFVTNLRSLCETLQDSSVVIWKATQKVLHELKSADLERIKIEDMPVCIQELLLKDIFSINYRERGLLSLYAEFCRSISYEEVL